MVVLLIWITGAWVIAQQAPLPLAFIPPEETQAHFTVETVLHGLDRPGGLAVRPGWSKEAAVELFFVEAGTGRVLKMATDAPGATQEVIAGFPTDNREGTPSDSFHGPPGLLFLTHGKLVVYGDLGGVGSSGHADGPDGAKRKSHPTTGQPSMNIYRLPVDRSILKAEQTAYRLGPVSPGDPSEDRLRWEEGGWSYGLAKTREAVFAVSGGASRSWILRAPWEANRLTDLQPFIATRGSTCPTILAGITVNPAPRLPYLVVGLMGSVEVSRDSGLAFYSPKSGRLAFCATTGLHDLVGLSYSPEGTLYGIDLAWQTEIDGGIYRLDDARLAGKPSCRAMKIVSIPRPTSLVFAPDGSLYVTAWGSTPAKKKTNPDQKTGVLLKITGKW